MAVILWAVAGLAIVGGGGWWVAMLHRQTLQRLRQTQAALDEKAASLAMVEEQRQRLSSDYETLKGRWTTADEQVQRLQGEAAKTQEELAAAAKERASVQQQLTQTQSQQAALQVQLEQVRRQANEEAARRASLEARLEAAAASGLSRAETEQLSEALVWHDRQVTALDERLQALSHAFEQLAWKHIELQEAAPGAVLPLDAASLSRPEPKAHQQQNKQLAARYRHLGEFCFAAYQYPRAAEAFERSLTYHDDPEVHARLAFLYGRLWLNPDKAAQHAAQAGPNALTAKEHLDPSTKAQGYPRSTPKLVWKWLKP